MTDARPLAIVTGGSSGIGLELAHQFAEHGYDVAITGSSDKVHEAARTLRKLGVEACPHQADAATYDGVKWFWTFVRDLDRPVEAAALNVGIGIGGAFVDNTLEAEFRPSPDLGPTPSQTSALSPCGGQAIASRERPYAPRRRLGRQECHPQRIHQRSRWHSG